MEYLKDWRIWLMCVVVALLIIITDEVWAEEPEPTTKDAVVENMADWYYGFHKFAEKVVDLKFQPTTSCGIRWRWNKADVNYSVNETTTLYFNSEVGIKKHGAEFGITIEF